MALEPIDIDTLAINPFTMIGNEWWAIGVGDEARGLNAMCASWGTLGSLWERRDGVLPPHRGLPVATVYVRPQRTTRELLDENDLFTLSVLGPEHRRAMAFLGAKAGRDVPDKVKAAGLTPVFAHGTGFIGEAKLALVCRVLYQAPLVEDGFRDRALIDANYPKRDFHEMYVGEIVAAYADPAHM